MRAPNSIVLSLDARTLFTRYSQVNNTRPDDEIPTHHRAGYLLTQALQNDNCGGEEEPDHHVLHTQRHTRLDTDDGGTLRLSDERAAPAHSSVPVVPSQGKYLTLLSPQAGCTKQRQSLCFTAQYIPWVDRAAPFRHSTFGLLHYTSKQKM